MDRDPRLDQILELIALIFADKSLSASKTREALVEVQEEIEVRLDALRQDAEPLNDFTEDEDRNC
jgi:hypothetical protein